MKKNRFPRKSKEKTDKNKKTNTLKNLSMIVSLKSIYYIHNCLQSLIIWWRIKQHHPQNGERKATPPTALGGLAVLPEKGEPEKATPPTRRVGGERSTAIVKSVWSSKMPFANTPVVWNLLDGPVGVDAAFP